MYRKLHSRYFFYQYIIYVLESKPSIREVVILVGFREQYYWFNRFCQCLSWFLTISFAHWPNFRLPTQISFSWGFSLDSRGLSSALGSLECQRINDAQSSLQAIATPWDNLNHVFYELLEFLNWIKLRAHSGNLFVNAFFISCLLFSFLSHFLAPLVVCRDHFPNKLFAFEYLSWGQLLKEPKLR